MIFRLCYQKTGNSSDTLFWHQTWLDGIALKECFTRLFNSSLDKDVNVKAMVSSCSEGGWSGGEICLYVWGVDLIEECKGLLSNILLQDNMEDVWIWNFNSDKLFMSKTPTSIYQILKL